MDTLDNHRISAELFSSTWPFFNSGNWMDPAKSLKLECEARVALHHEISSNFVLFLLSGRGLSRNKQIRWQWANDFPFMKFLSDALRCTTQPRQSSREREKQSKEWEFLETANKRTHIRRAVHTHKHLSIASQNTEREKESAATADGRDKSCAVPKNQYQFNVKHHLFLYGAHAPSTCSIYALGPLHGDDDDENGNGLGISFSRPGGRRQNREKKRTKSPWRTSKQLKRKETHTQQQQQNDERRRRMDLCVGNFVFLLHSVTNSRTDGRWCCVGQQQQFEEYKMNEKYSLWISIEKKNEKKLKCSVCAHGQFGRKTRNNWICCSIHFDFVHFALFFLLIRTAAA